MTYDHAERGIFRPWTDRLLLLAAPFVLNGHWPFAELRTSYELHRGRMADPGWVPTLPLAPSPAAVEVHYEAEPILAPRGKRGRGGRINAAARSPSMQV